MAYSYKGIKIGGKKIDEHRHVVQQMIGRVLTSNEVVHHKNGNKLDNRADNLEIMNRSEHSREHRTGAKLSNEIKKKISNSLKGKRPKNAPLSDADISEIRALIDSGIGPTEIARRKKINKCTVIDIAKGRRYAYVI